MMKIIKPAIGMIVLAFTSLILITGSPFQIATNLVENNGHLNYKNIGQEAYGADDDGGDDGGGDDGGGDDGGGDDGGGDDGGGDDGGGDGDSDSSDGQSEDSSFIGESFDDGSGSSDESPPTSQDGSSNEDGSVDSSAATFFGDSDEPTTTSSESQPTLQSFSNPDDIADEPPVATPFSLTGPQTETKELDNFEGLSEGKVPNNDVEEPGQPIVEVKDGKNDMNPVSENGEADKQIEMTKEPPELHTHPKMCLTSDKKCMKNLKEDVKKWDEIKEKEKKDFHKETCENNNGKMKDGECKIKYLKDRTEYEDALCDNNTDDYPKVCKVKDDNDDNDEKKIDIHKKVKIINKNKIVVRNYDNTQSQIIVVSDVNTCPTQSETVPLSGKIIPKGIRLLADFGPCKIKDGGVTLNIPDTQNIKLAALFMDKTSSNNYGILINPIKVQKISSNQALFTIQLDGEMTGTSPITGKSTTLTKINGLALYNSGANPINLNAGNMAALTATFSK